MIRFIVKLAACLFIAVCSPGMAHAQENDNDPGPQPLPDEIAGQFEQKLAEIEVQNE